MATYQDHIRQLRSIYKVKDCAYAVCLTEKDYEAIEAGIEALKTLQDMGTYIQKIINNRYKGEDNKP